MLIIISVLIFFLYSIGCAHFCLLFRYGDGYTVILRIAGVMPDLEPVKNFMKRTFLECVLKVPPVRRVFYFATTFIQRNGNNVLHRHETCLDTTGFCRKQFYDPKCIICSFNLRNHSTREKSNFRALEL